MPRTTDYLHSAFAKEVDAASAREAFIQACLTAHKAAQEKFKQTARQGRDPREIRSDVGAKDSGDDLPSH